MNEFNLDKFKGGDGSLFIPRPKVYFDWLCHEYGEMTMENKVRNLAHLVANEMNLSSIITNYMETHSAVTLSSLKATLGCYIQYFQGIKQKDWSYTFLDELSEIQLCDMLQNKLEQDYDKICNGLIFPKQD